jgi:hypothetical protein
MLVSEDFRFILQVMLAENYSTVFNKMYLEEALELNRLCEEYMDEYDEDTYQEGFNVLQAKYERMYNVKTLQELIKAKIYSY